MDAATELAGDHPRAGAGSSAEVHLGGAHAAAHELLEFLEAVLPQVPAVLTSRRDGTRVRAWEARRSRLRR